MLSNQFLWKRSRPLWFRLPRLIRIGWILSAIALGPFKRRWPLAPERIRALLLVRDLYSTLPGLVESFLLQGILAKHILLFDSGSTNPACLATLSDLEQRGCCLIRIPSHERCFGPYVPWLSPTLRAMISTWDYPYLVSDPDLAIPTTIPIDWLAKMLSLLNEHRSLLKVALPLSVSDISVDNSASIIAHEKGLYLQPAYRLLSFYLLRRNSGATICPTDTTLALYRPSRMFSTFSIRLASQYSIVHLPWYHCFSSTPEYKYYQSHKLSLFGAWSSISAYGSG